MFKWHVMHALAEELFQFLCNCNLLLRRKLDYKFSVQHVNPFSVLSMLARKAHFCAKLPMLEPNKLIASYNKYVDYLVYSALRVRLFVLPVQIWD